ncbi:hypothetical protein ACOSQ4_014066 [Xanthoceras sorbifolium]
MINKEIHFAGCTVVSKDGAQEVYSGCIMAVHAPDALKMLGSQVMTEIDIGLADSYIDGDFSFENKDEGIMKLIMGNDFFAMFLDESMTLSCVVFKYSKDEDLKVAQMRKNFSSNRETIINEKHEVLELGSGWRTLAIETVKRTGCKYTGINIVEEQLKYAEMKAKEAGLQVNTS